MFEDSSNEADFSFQGKVNHVISREGLIGKFPEGFFKFWVNFSFSSRVPYLDLKRIYHQKLKNAGLSSIFSYLIFFIKNEWVLFDFHEHHYWVSSVSCWVQQFNIFGLVKWSCQKHFVWNWLIFSTKRIECKRHNRQGYI